MLITEQLLENHCARQLPADLQHGVGQGGNVPRVQGLPSVGWMLGG